MGKLRNRKSPERFGNPVPSTQMNSSLDETAKDPYSDDSFEDELFNPPTKKKKTAILETSTIVETLKLCNFDEDFEKIESDSKIGNSTKLNCDQINGADDGSLMQNDVICQQFTSLDMKFIQQQLLSLNQNTAQILARITVIEESLISNGTLMTVKTGMTEKNAFQSYNVFVESNHLPLKSLEDLREFESNLKDDSWNENAVNQSKINFPNLNNIISNVEFRQLNFYRLMYSQTFRV